MSEEEKKWEAHPLVSRGRLEEDLADRRVETKYSFFTMVQQISSMFIHVIKLKIIEGNTQNYEDIYVKSEILFWVNKITTKCRSLGESIQNYAKI